jgi:hypothetical protein
MAPESNGRDAEPRLIQQTASYGAVTIQGFDTLTDRLTAILAGSGNVVENVSCTYDGGPASAKAENPMPNEMSEWSRRRRRSRAEADKCPFATWRRS